jgi:PAS domain S-box-containing protein
VSDLVDGNKDSRRGADLKRALRRVAELERQLAEAQTQGRSLAESESGFRSLAENSSAVVLRFDKAFRFLYANPTVEAVTGIPRDFFLGKTLRELAVPEETAAFMESALGRVLETGRAFATQFELAGRDGVVVQDWHLVPEFYAKGRVETVMSTCNDITDLKNTQTALAEKEQLLRAVVDHMPASVYLKDTQGRYLLVNRNFSRWCDVSPEDAVGRTVFDFFSREWAEIYAAQERRVMETGQTVEEKVEVLHLDNILRSTMVVKFPVHDGTGEVAGVGGVTVDISRLEHAEESLRLHADIFRTLPLGVFIYRYLAPDRLILTDANPASLRLTGVDIEEWRGRDIDTIFPMARETGLTGRLLQVMETGEGFVSRDTEITDPWLDGSFQVTAFRQSDDLVAVIFENIAERKRSEIALRESEERLMAIMDHSPAAIFLKDVAGRYLMVNKMFEARHQISRAEVQGLTAFDIYSWDQAEEITEQDRQVLKKGDDLEFETRQAYPDGSVRDVMLIKFPVLGADGIVAGIGGISVDMSEHKRAEQAFRQSEERLRGAVESMQEAFALFDEDDRLVAVNDAYRRVNPAAEEVLRKGLRFEDLIRANMARGALVEAVGDEEEFLRKRVEQHLNPGPPIVRSVRGMGTFLLKETRTPEGGIALSFIDVTELKRTEKELRIARDQAESANRAKSEFLATMSHELRTPLNSIIGFSEIIKNQMFGQIGLPKYVDYAADIHNSGKHLLNIVGDILDLSKIEAGHMELEESIVDVAETITASTTLIRETAQENGLSLNMVLPDPPPRITGDRRAVTQMLLNLLSNSVKFTPSGGTITVTALHDEAGTISLSVSDTGAGMGAEDLSKVTQPFVQVQNVMTRSHGGTGLGLSIVKALMETHGGTFLLASTPGAGTVATLRFPAERVVN